MHPQEGPTTGGNIVRFAGEGFDARTLVLFGNAPAPKILVQDTACYVQAPAQACGSISVAVCDTSACITVAQPYVYHRSPLTRESALTRLVRTLLQNLKAHFHSNTSITVDIDAADMALDTEGGVAMLARLPALVLGGPEMRENRIQSRNVGCEVEDARGNVFIYPAPYTVDLGFNLTGASHSTVEMFNMLDAAVAHLNQTKFVSMPRDALFKELGELSWALHIDDGARVHLDGIDGVRSFGLNFSVRGFDLGATYPTSVAAKTMGASIAIGKELS
jgi:hypothetical protein